MKKYKAPSFADSICDLSVIKVKSTFFDQINSLIDWKSISKMINTFYHKEKSTVGKPSYNGLLLFKMNLLQTWYGLNDHEVEDRINDSISFSRFCNLSLEQTAPDHSTLSRFITHMIASAAYDKILHHINQQLEEHQVLVSTGAIVNARFIDTPLKHKGKGTYKEVPATKKSSDIVNKEASRVKKADKGYQSSKNNAILKRQKLNNHILKKVKINEISTVWDKRFNKLISKTRYRVERTFGSIVRWFKGGTARYRAIGNMRTQKILESICYNLYISHGIIVSNFQTSYKIGSD